MTFDVANLAQLGPQDVDALRVLRDLRTVPGIEVYGTEPGWGGQFTVSPVVEEDSQAVDYSTPDGSIGRTWVLGVRHLPATVAHHIGYPVIDLIEPALQRAVDDVVVAQALRAVGSDLLVTASPTLLRSPAAGIAAHANARSPADAAALVGLFLRSREFYGDGRRSYGRGGFYWVLMRHWTPAFWRYIEACVPAPKVRGDDAMELGGSLLARCVRALEARDATGVAFYSIPHAIGGDRARPVPLRLRHARAGRCAGHRGAGCAPGLRANAEGAVRLLPQ